MGPDWLQMSIFNRSSQQKHVLFSPAAWGDETPRQDKEQRTTPSKAGKHTPQIQQYWHDRPEEALTLSNAEESKRASSPDAEKRRGTKRPPTRTVKKTNKYKYISLMECSQHLRELVNVYAVR